MKTTPLPLEANVERCLGHGNKPREWCARINECARNATIRYDFPAKDCSNRCCTSDLMAGFIPLAGFPDEEVAA